MPKSEAKSGNAFSFEFKSLSFDNNKFIYWVSFFLFRAILIFFIYALFSVILCFISWLLISRTYMLKDIKKIGFFSYLIQNKYMSFAYTFLTGFVSSNKFDLSRDFFCPYPSHPYLIRGKNYAGNFTYGFIGKYKGGREFNVKEDGFDKQYVVMELLSKDGKTYSFRYDISSSSILPSLNNSGDLGLPELYNEIPGISYSYILNGKVGYNYCRSLRNIIIYDYSCVNLDGLDSFMNPNCNLSVPVSVSSLENYYRDKLVFVKFLSSFDINEVINNPDFQYDIVLSASY